MTGFFEFIKNVNFQTKFHHLKIVEFSIINGGIKFEKDYEKKSK